MPLRYVALAQQRLVEATQLLRMAESMRSPYSKNHAPSAADRQARMAVLALKKAKQHTQAAIARLNGEDVTESSSFE